MRKTVLAMWGVCLSLCSGGAYAIVQCVALSPTATTCTATPANYKNKLNWMATCTTGSIVGPVRGVAACVNTTKTSGEIPDAGTVIPTPAVGHSAAMVGKPYYGRYACVCKITYPALSRWVTPGFCNEDSCYSFLTIDDCHKDCGFMCASAMAGMYGNGGSAFKNAILTTFTKS